MPYERPARLDGDDDTQDDWATDLFASLDGQSEAVETDEPDEDSSETNTLLPAIKNQELKDLVTRIAPAFQAHMAAAQQKLDALNAQSAER